MKYVFLFIAMAGCMSAFPQSSYSYFVQMAVRSNISQPVPAKFAFKSVRVPIKTDSLSMEQFHLRYYKTMEAGTVLLTSGALITASHILVAAFVPHFNRDVVISLATIGVATATAGSIVLPLGASERHRYKRTLKIELARRNL